MIWKSHIKERRISGIGILPMILWAALVIPVFAQSDADFGKANDEFAKGQFQDAIRDYKSLVDAKQWSAPLFYNLGNAYFRTGDFGRAILNYERALALEPRQPEAAANIAVAREEARSAELQNGRFDSILKHATPNQFTIAAAVGFWLMVFAIAVMVLGRRRSAVSILVAVLCFLMTAGTVVAVYEMENSRATVAIVTGPNVRARLATADNASSVMQLPAGSEIRILSRRGDWVYAVLPNSQRGWIPTSSVEPVRL